MNQLWVRALAVGVLVILAALLLKFMPPIVVLVVFVGGISLVYTTGRRRARAPELRTGVDLLGLKRETVDPFGILGFPLTLFGRANDPAIDELVWGPWRALDVHSFALSFEPPSPTGELTPRTTFACAMAKVGGPFPGLVVEPQTFLTSLQVSPPGTPVETGDGAFDAAMNVWCEDESFALRVLDDAARAWFRSLDLHWGVEVRGQVAMIYGPRPERPDLVATLEVLRDLLERLPNDLGASRPPA